MVYSSTFFALAALPFLPVHAIDLDIASTDSITSAASTIAKGLVSYYHGTEPGHIIGVLDAPYFWWESGAMFDTMIQYWHLTGDEQYNDIVSQGLLFQQGPDGNFLPPNQTSTEGNDDQSTWALAAMSAAEAKLPAPQGSSWLSLAEAVFNSQGARWDTETCSGGLRWQIFTFNNGYDWKNSASNGQFFELASRLAYLTGNNTYSDVASRTFRWSVTTGLIDEEWKVFDGANVEQNCSNINKIQLSLYAATYISGAAYMYNITSGDDQANWRTTLNGLLNQTISTFFVDGVATEVACESIGTCTTDMKAMKGLLAQRLVKTIEVAPYTFQLINPLLQSTAEAAAKACSDSKCPFTWGDKGTDKGSQSGVGEQLDALSFVQALLVKSAGNKSSTTVTGAGAGNGTTSSNATDTASGTHTGSLASGTGISSPPGDNGAMRMEGFSMGIVVAFWISMVWLAN
ncbi:hypothetical protein B7463_g8236, partial [Scytalidium lignicola]